MDKRLHGLLIANGALVLLSGFAAGFLYGTALTATLIANPPVSALEALRAWHMAHLEGVLNGLLMLAAAAAAAHMTLSAGAQRTIFWGLLIAGWGNVIAASISASTGGRGLSATGLDWNTLDFVLFVFGIVGAVAAMVTIAIAGFRTPR